MFNLNEMFNLKRKIQALLILCALLVSAGTAYAGPTSPGSGSPTTPGALCLDDADTWVLCESTFTFGDASAAIADGEFTALTVGTLTAGGIVLTGNLDMDGYNIAMDTDGDFGFFNDRHASVAGDAFSIGKTAALDFTFTVDTFTALSGSNVTFETAAFSMGTATDDTGTFTMIKGAQAGDPQVQFALSADDQGDFSITTDTGDIDLVAISTLDIAATSGVTFDVNSLVTAESYTNTSGTSWSVKTTPGSASTANVMTIEGNGANWTSGSVLKLITDDDSLWGLSINDGSVTKFLIERDGDIISQGDFDFVGGGEFSTTANGDISFRPNGTGDTVFTGDTEGGLNMFDTTFTKAAAAGAISQNDSTFTRTTTANDNDISGAIVKIDNNSTTSGTDGSIHLQIGDTADGHLSGGTTGDVMISGDLEIDGSSFFDGRVLETQGADVASATNLTLGTDGNVFEITGTTKIDLISNLGWQNGAEITLVCNESVTFDDGTATSSTNITLVLAGGVDFSCTADVTLVLKLTETTASGQAWREVSRSVN